MKLLIITHSFAQGPAQELFAFFQGKEDSVELISHPFSYCPDTRSTWESNHTSSRKIFSRWSGPSLGFYLKDLFLSIYWGWSEKYDWIIACDCLNALAALILRAFGKTRRVIFYSIDYSPQRFPSRWINEIYHRIDRCAATRSSLVWNLSPKMNEGRKKRWPGIALAPEQIVPTGANIDRIQRAPEEKATPLRLVYMGHLRRFQGIELALQMTKRLRSEFSEIHLEIFGGGDAESSLRQQCHELELDDCVTFHGFVDSHEELENQLAQGGIGLALYEPHPESFTFNADPNKPQVYMACGLPLLITEVPSIARELAKCGAAKLVQYEVDDAASAAAEWIRDRLKFLEARRSALDFAKSRSWPVLFRRALNETQDFFQEK